MSEYIHTENLIWTSEYIRTEKLIWTSEYICTENMNECPNKYLCPIYLSTCILPYHPHLKLLCHCRHLKGINSLAVHLSMTHPSTKLYCSDIVKCCIAFDLNTELLVLWLSPAPPKTAQELHRNAEQCWRLLLDNNWLEWIILVASQQHPFLFPGSLDWNGSTCTVKFPDPLPSQSGNLTSTHVTSLKSTNRLESRLERREGTW